MQAEVDKLTAAMERLGTLANGQAGPDTQKQMQVQYSHVRSSFIQPERPATFGSPSLRVGSDSHLFLACMQECYDAGRDAIVTYIAVANKGLTRELNKVETPFD